MNTSRLRVRVGTMSGRVALAAIAVSLLTFNFVPASAQGGGSRPVAHDRSARIIEGKERSIKLKGKASEGGNKALVYTISSFPQHGTLTEMDTQKGKVTYTPDSGFSGEDAFAFTVNDGTAESDPGNVRLMVYKRGEAPTGPSLTADEVRTIVQVAATSINDSTAVVAVIDRAGRVLAVYKRSGANKNDVERALALARTGAFFSNNAAPLSSRTVRTLGGVHFPPGIRDAGPSDLYSIETTNRGCPFNVTYNPGKDYPVYTNLDGTGPGLGIGTGKPDFYDDAGKVVDPDGFPIYKNNQVAGGIGVTVAFPYNLGTQGVTQATTAAEYASFQASLALGGPALPLPPPNRVYLGGIELPFSPFLDQIDRGIPTPTPTGAGPGVGSFDPNRFIFGPVAGGFAPDGWLVGPLSGRRLTAAQVNNIVMNCFNEAKITRAAIRLPLGSPASMVFAVGDIDGTLLGVFRMPDSTIFSIDVAIAKSRNVVWFSTDGYVDLPGIPPGTAVTNNTLYAGGQPFFPIGINNSQPGPFFDTFLRDAANPCTQGSQRRNPNQSGIVWFPGSAPLFSGNTIVGGLGVSGDGVTQDDVVTSAGTTGYEAPLAIRADQVIIRGVRMPYMKFNRNPHVP
ncbi:MAG TPA: heme-binding protein [Blastocatellia bacterium]|nr:heme-binding protein [Blastocatellia bacterium]